QSSAALVPGACVLISAPEQPFNWRKVVREQRRTRIRWRRIGAERIKPCSERRERDTFYLDQSRSSAVKRTEIHLFGRFASHHYNVLRFARGKKVNLRKNRFHGLVHGANDICPPPLDRPHDIVCEDAIGRQMFGGQFKKFLGR